MPISPELAQPLMMMAGLGIICWLLMRGRVTRKRGQYVSNHMLDLKHNARAAGHSRPFTGTSSLGAPSEVLKWQVELHDLGRELKAELDCKLLAVQAMTQAYDQASERLVNLMRAAHQFGAAESNPVQLVQQLAAQGVTQSQIAQSLGIAEADVARLLGEPSMSQ